MVTFFTPRPFGWVGGGLGQLITSTFPIGSRADTVRVDNETGDVSHTAWFVGSIEIHAFSVGEGVGVSFSAFAFHPHRAQTPDNTVIM